MVRLAITALGLLMVLVDFTTWIMSFTVEAVIFAAILVFLWWDQIKAFMQRKP